MIETMLDAAVSKTTREAVDSAVELAQNRLHDVVDAVQDVTHGREIRAAKRRTRMSRQMLFVLTLVGLGAIAWVVVRRMNTDAVDQQEIVPDVFGEAVLEEREHGAFTHSN